MCLLVRLFLLVGSNGAGKLHFFFRTISGLIKAKSGKIKFIDNYIQTLLRMKLLLLGISQSPEGRMVFPDMTVKENLLMGCFAFLPKMKFKQI